MWKACKQLIETHRMFLISWRQTALRWFKTNIYIENNRPSSIIRSQGSQKSSSSYGFFDADFSSPPRIQTLTVHHMIISHKHYDKDIRYADNRSVGLSVFGKWHYYWFGLFCKQSIFNYFSGCLVFEKAQHDLKRLRALYVTLIHYKISPSFLTRKERKTLSFFSHNSIRYAIRKTFQTSFSIKWLLFKYTANSFIWFLWKFLKFSGKQRILAAEVAISRESKTWTKDFSRGLPLRVVRAFD